MNKIPDISYTSTGDNSSLINKFCLQKAFFCHVYKTLIETKVPSRSFFYCALWWNRITYWIILNKFFSFSYKKLLVGLLDSDANLWIATSHSIRIMHNQEESTHNHSQLKTYGFKSGNIYKLKLFWTDIWN